jgi:endonuclease/exonuclease/phosphatase family metal-dependent hydrolase
MTRDPDLLAECRDLQCAVEKYRTLAELRAAPEWAALAARFASLLGMVRRHAAPRDPGPAADPASVHVVHWNIEHGNWYDLVLEALTSHPDLRDADVLSFNEIDFGMARAANRDVTAELAGALLRHAVWTPLFLETTLGRDEDPVTAAGRENEESLFGLAILSRWPIGEVRTLELPSPEAYQFDVERMVGRHVALIATIERPGAPFVAVTAHLEVHRTRAMRAAQMAVLLEALRDERRPIVLTGDFNTHTFDRGRPWDPLVGAAVLMLSPGGALARRMLHPDRGPARETLFDLLAAHGFEWERYVDRRPTLQLRFDRIDEVRMLPRGLLRAARGVFAWAERRGRLRLDWIAGRGWRGGRGHTVTGLDGPGKASDHAPITARLEAPATAKP